MQTTIKAILWDIHGVLYTGDFKVIHQELGRRIGVDGNTMLELFREYLPTMLTGHVTSDQFAVLLTSKFGASGDVKKVFTDVIREHVVLRPEVIAIVDSLRTSVKEVAFTNLTSQREEFDQEVKTFSHFDDAILSFKVGLKKPDPEFYHFACKKLNVPATEMLLIDDSGKNIATAKTLGMKTIHYESTEKLKAELHGFGLTV